MNETIKTTRNSTNGANGGGFFKNPKKVKVMLITAVSVLIVALVVLGAFVYPVLYNPQSLFEPNKVPVNAPSPAKTPETWNNVVSAAEPKENPELNSEPIATPPPDYLEQLEGMADFSNMKNITNVLLIGVDYAQEREDNKKEYVNKNFNSDVMMLIACNFETGTADLISVPRDTYAKIANADGKYKLNFSLALGGGINDAGFMNVCKSVEWVLGGVPVNYYVAVTMPMLKDVVDTIGGVEYDIDVAYNVQGRRYAKGMQHLDGQGVLDYCRARKNMSESGDANRVNRQKKMMLKVFDTMRNKTELKDVPTLINTLSQNVYTNMNFGQLAALAVLGNSLNLDTVEMYSFTGPKDLLFNFGYVFLDQNKRVKLIKDIYGADVPKENNYIMDVARDEWAEMQREQIVPRAQEALDKSGIDEYWKEQIQSDINNLKNAGELETTDAALNALKNSCGAVGLKVDWKVDVYSEDQVPMLE